MNKKITVPSIVEMKARKEKITMVTAYDYCFATLADEACDMILVGDSLGNVIMGDDTTLGVTMDIMVHHTKCVTKAAKRALVVADMPFMSYQADFCEAIKNAGRLVSESGACAVKLEGACELDIKIINHLTSIGVPVMGHIGLTPQSVNVFGGFKTQGTSGASAKRIFDEAIRIQDAGAFAVVLEKIPSELAAKITQELKIPTIGIGAGPDCDGQVIVMHDMLGLFDKFKPSFVKRYAELGKTVRDAFENYSKEVKGGVFPEK